MVSCAPLDKPTLYKTTYDALPDWGHDGHAEALHAFVLSCVRPLPEEEMVGGVPVNKVAWQEICDKAEKIKSAENQQAQQFFEQYFTPYFLSTPRKNKALYTGYFIPIVQGSLAHSDDYSVPIYALPKECVDSQCYSRKQIDEGVLKGRGLEIAWLKDPIDAFFMQIQGSGYMELENGTRAKVAYGGNNGHDYYPIGRWLKERGEIPAKDISLETIQAWMRAHPEQQGALMNRNARYIFFTLETTEEGIKGAQQVALTPRRSLAIDPAIMPYGLPVYVTAETEDTHITRFKHLMIAQDTGSAIKGPLRGDIFFGVGAQAKKDASDFAQIGEMFILLPKAQEADGE